MEQINKNKKILFFHCEEKYFWSGSTCDNLLQW